MVIVDDRKKLHYGSIAQVYLHWGIMKHVDLGGYWARILNTW